MFYDIFSLLFNSFAIFHILLVLLGVRTVVCTLNKYLPDLQDGESLSLRHKDDLVERSQETECREQPVCAVGQQGAGQVREDLDDQEHHGGR